jgi:tetratricopeptide (TPR) repeat protein
MARTQEPQKRTLPARLGLIQALLAAEDQVEARKQLDQALEIGRVPDLLLQDAVLKTMQKNLPAARASLEEVLKAAPERVEAWRLLVQIYAAEKQVAKVVPRLREAIDRNPKSAPLQYLLAEVLLSSGQRQEAKTALLSATAADPGFEAADLLLAQLAEQDGALEEARRRISGVLSKNANSVSAMVMMGDIETKSGNRTEAMAQYRSVVDKDGSNMAALNNLAYLQAKEDPDGALVYAQKAAELAPGNSSVQDTLGWIYYRKGLYQVALTHLKYAVTLGDTPVHKYHFGMACLKAGDREQGQKALRAALESDPNLAKKEVDW